jgi:hypothetical protein
MRYFSYLKNIFRLYLISGIALGLAFSSSIIAYRYNNYLLDTIQIAENISIKKEKVKGQTHKIDATLKYLRDDLSFDITDIDGEKLIFQTLDNIKTELKDALITVSTFEETENEKRLPAGIKLSVENYKNIVDYIGYIESFRIPEYKINQLSISKEQGGDITLDIKGAIVMPSLKDK